MPELYQSARHAKEQDFMGRVDYLYGGRHARSYVYDSLEDLRHPKPARTSPVQKPIRKEYRGSNREQRAVQKGSSTHHSTYDTRVSDDGTSLLQGLPDKLHGHEAAELRECNNGDRARTMDWTHVPDSSKKDTSQLRGHRKANRRDESKGPQRYEGTLKEHKSYDNSERSSTEKGTYNRRTVAPKAQQDRRLDQRTRDSKADGFEEQRDIGHQDRFRRPGHGSTTPRQLSPLRHFGIHHLGPRGRREHLYINSLHEHNYHRSEGRSIRIQMPMNVHPVLIPTAHHPTTMSNH